MGILNRFGKQKKQQSALMRKPDDQDPQGEVNIAVHLDSGTVWPVQKVMKRFSNGAEDSIYAYGVALNDMAKKAGR